MYESIISPIAINRNSLQAAGLIGWWPATGRPTVGFAPVFDLSGFGNHAAAGARQTAWLPDAALGAYRKAYNGVNWGYHVIPNAVQWNESDDLTICGWFLCEALTTLDTFATRWDGGTNLSWAISVDTNGVRFDTSATGGFEPGNICTATSTLTTNVGHHIACVHDSVAQTNKVYVNGVLKATTNSVAAGIYNGALAIHVMHCDSFASSERGLTGAFTDFRIYKSALSADMVWKIYAPSTRFDLYRMIEPSWEVSAGAALARAWGQII